ncbi:DUF3592 domain-containing protein [Patescibacteria group bacterium]
MRFEVSQRATLFEGKAAGKIISMVFLPLGIVILLLGGYLLNDTQSFLKETESTVGYVVENIRDEDAYKPVIVYETSDGRNLEFSPNISANPPQYDVNESVEVIYKADDPYQVRINTPANIYNTPGIAFFVGGLFFVIGIIALFIKS